MAEVWLGQDAAGRRAAVKWLRADATPALARSFAVEVEALARLEHRGIVHLLSSGRAGGRPWLAMEVIDGTDLGAFGAKLQSRPAHERHLRVRELGVQLAEALDYLHRAGFVHRDIKPSNVLWSEARAVLADFGVVAAPGGAVERGFVGSVAWAAPEVLLGKSADARADQYGLGLVLYWCLTGARPFDEGRRAHPRAPPRPPSERDPTVPADLEAVVLRCTALDPALRYPDLAAVAAALRALTGSTASRVAGRQEAADRVVRALDRVAGGAGCVVRLDGPRGAGQRMLGELAGAAAHRRGLACVAADLPDIAAHAASRVRAGEPLCLVTTAEIDADEVVELPPLTVADLRRSIFGVAPATPALAAAAEALRAWSGGSFDLVEHALATGVVDDRFELGRVPAVDPAPWLGGLDLDAASVGAALAALRDPADATTLETVAAAPAPESLPELAARGLATQVGERWLLSAEAFRAPLLALALDPDGLRERAAACTAAPVDDDPVLAAARAHVDAGRHAEAVQALVDAAGVADAEAHPERRLLLAALHWYLRDTRGAAAQWGEVRLRAHDPRARARAGIGLGVLRLQLGELGAAIDDLHRAQLDAELAGDARVAILAGMDLAEARVLRGQLAEALRVGRRARDEARALRDGALEAKAARALGQVCLDLGAWREAEASLADAAALARAAHLDEERLAARALRAEAALDARPDDRVAASVALDRLMGHGVVLHDPEGFTPYLEALRAEAQARLGEVDRARASLALALATSPPAVMRVRLALRIARVQQALGDTPAARTTLLVAHDQAAAHGADLLVWRAATALARLDGTPLPDAGALCTGLADGERAALSTR